MKPLKLAAAVLPLVALSLLVSGSSALAAPTALPIPAIPNVAPLPGPIAQPSQPAAKMGILTTSPQIGLPGKQFTIAGKGFPASTDVEIEWGTANVTWVVDARPDSVDYMGRQAQKLNVVLAHAKTDASGNLAVKLQAPRDFGGIHDIYAVVSGQQLAKGGFLISRSASISPKSGPIGTMITVRYSGLGSSLYEGGAALLWDNKFAGAMMANWTRGDAVAHIRASGPVGVHTLEVADAISFKYLNIEQSPIPWGTGFKLSFRVTKDNGRPKAQIDWPAKIAPTMNAKTTLQLDTTGSTTSAALSKTSGPILTKTQLTAKGLDPSAPADLEWATVVGNRVNCTGTCWSFVSVPLGKATVAADGTLSTMVKIPDGLGGWHELQVLQNGAIKTQTPFYVNRSIDGKGVSSLVLHEGQHFTVHLKGLGWTELDNTTAVDYDNSYIGYGCGFNSQGDVVMNLVATGGPGTHLIDMYPLLYTNSPSYANTPYGMIPILTYERDAPGLALGYDLPAIRLAITIVK